jgi:hypothetical protein
MLRIRTSDETSASVAARLTQREEPAAAGTGTLTQDTPHARRIVTSRYILACDTKKMSIESDSRKKKSANPGMRKDMARFWRFAILIVMMISVRSQDKFMRGTNTKRSRRMLNAVSV